MKEFRETVSQTFRFFTGHDKVGYAEEFQIAQKGFGSGAADIVGDQNSFSSQTCGELCGFSAWSGTEIQDSIPGCTGRQAAGVMALGSCK